MQKNITEFLSLLNKVATENACTVYVPTLKKEVKFKNISTLQQKKLIESVVDNPVFQTRLITAMYEIITENCLEKEALQALTYIDGVAVIFQLRVSSYGSKYRAFIEGKEHIMDFSTVVDNAKNLQFLETTTLNDGLYTITIGVPTFKEHYEGEMLLRKEKNLNEAEIVNPGEVVGDAFISEISKFIKTVTINNETPDKAVTIDFKTLNFKQRFSVLDKLPVSLAKEIVMYIEKSQDLQRQLLTFIGTSIDGGSIRKAIVPLDSTLFTLNES